MNFFFVYGIMHFYSDSLMQALISVYVWAADSVKIQFGRTNNIFIEHIKIEERTMIVVNINGLNHKINNWK